MTTGEKRKNGEWRKEKKNTWIGREKIVSRDNERNQRIYKHSVATFIADRSRCPDTNHFIWTAPCLVIMPSFWANVRRRWGFRQIQVPAVTVLFPFLRCLETWKYILVLPRWWYEISTKNSQSLGAAILENYLDHDSYKREKKKRILWFVDG